ncbi:MAG: hypothetical protein ABI391_05325 [Hyphomicrobiaceae bacterium]
MYHPLELELAAVSLACWGLSLVAMWFLVDRKSRPGPIRSVAAIEAMMLVSIFCLILGVTFIVWGSGAAG